MDSIITVVLVAISLLYFATFLKLEKISKRDGPAQVEPGKRYSGVLLEHVEALSPNSPLYQPFRLNLFFFTSELFFSDFQEQTYSLSILHWVARIAILTVGYFYLYVPGLENAFWALLGFVAIQQMTFERMAGYYYLRYYDIDFQLDVDDEDE